MPSVARGQDEHWKWCSARPKLRQYAGPIGFRGVGGKIRARLKFDIPIPYSAALSECFGVALRGKVVVGGYNIWRPTVPSRKWPVWGTKAKPLVAHLAGGFAVSDRPAVRRTKNLRLRSKICWSTGTERFRHFIWVHRLSLSFPNLMSTGLGRPTLERSLSR